MNMPFYVPPEQMMRDRADSMRVDEGRCSWSLLAIETKARAEVGREEKSLLRDPKSDSRLGREKEKDNVPKG